jgi:hypothetical protein
MTLRPSQEGKQTPFMEPQESKEGAYLPCLGQDPPQFCSSCSECFFSLYGHCVNARSLRKCFAGKTANRVTSLHLPSECPVIRMLSWASPSQRLLGTPSHNAAQPWEDCRCPLPTSHKTPPSSDSVHHGDRARGDLSAPRVPFGA